MYAATASMCAEALVSETPALGTTVKLATTPLPDIAVNVMPVTCAGVTPRTVASAFWYTTLIAAVTVEIFWLVMVIVACTEALGCMLAVAEADVMCGMIIGTTPTLVALVDTASGTLEMNDRARVDKLLRASDLASVAHERYSRVSGPTDVLTFVSDSDDGLEIDLLACLDEASRRAASYEHDVTHELLLYVVHGVLHAIGHDDHDPEAHDRMHAEEDRLLTEVGVGPVYRVEGGGG